MRTLLCSQAALLSFLILAVVLGGCDAFEQAERGKVVFEGREHTARGSTALSKTSSGLTAKLGSEGVFINTAGSSRADFYFRPVSTPEGSVFSAELVGALGEGKPKTLARILQRGIDRGQKRIEADLSGFGAKKATVEFRRSDELVYRKANAQIGSDGILPVGITNNLEKSYHVEDTEEGTIIEIDYEEQALDTLAKPATIKPAFKGAKAVECTHVAVIVPKTTALISIKGVKFRGRGDVGQLKLVEEYFE